MKRTALKVVLFLALCLPARDAAAGIIHLSTGQSFVLAFQELPFEMALPPLGGRSATGQVGFGPDSLDIGEQVKLEFFENSLSDVPFVSTLVPGPLGGIAISEQNVWQDLQGVFRLTVLQGSIDLSDYSVLVARDDQLFGLRVSLVPDSLPSVLPLGMAAVWFIAVRRKLQRRSAPNA